MWDIKRESFFFFLASDGSFMHQRNQSSSRNPRICENIGMGFIGALRVFFGEGAEKGGGDWGVRGG